MNRGWIASLTLAGITATSGTAWAQCAVVEPVIVPQVRVDPLDATGPAELVQPFILTFRRTGMEATPLVIRYQVVDEDSATRSRIGLSEGPLVAWNSDDSSRDTGALRSEAYPLLRSGQVSMAADDQVAQARLRMRLTDLRGDLWAGVYREQFTVRYWCGDTESTLPEESYGAIAASAVVPNVISANIAGASAQGEIDFLDFSIMMRNIQISVRSTGPYQITARSVNGGFLQREGVPSSNAADIIRYAASFDSQSLDTTGNVSRRMPRAGLLGRQMNMDVEIEDVDGKNAGNYADTLLLTLSPMN